jgi:hypothetical protein
MSRWEELQVAAAPVLADLERTRAGIVRLEPGAGGSDAILWEADDGGTGLWLESGDDEPEDAVVEITGKIQEIAIEALWRAWPESPTTRTAIRWARTSLTAS